MARHRKKHRSPPVKVEWTSCLRELFRQLPDDWSPVGLARISASARGRTISGRFRTSEGHVARAYVRIEAHGVTAGGVSLPSGRVTVWSQGFGERRP